MICSICDKPMALIRTFWQDGKKIYEYKCIGCNIWLEHWQ